MDRSKFLGILATVASVGFILGVSITIIAYGRGYRWDIKNRSLGTNGLITATSDPVGATVFIDGTKRTATNTNLVMTPGWYTVTIAKAGYQPWEKRVRVQGEVVTRVDAMLFSGNPSLFALSTTGVLSPVLSPDGSKLVFIVPDEETNGTNQGETTGRAGIWVLDLEDKPLAMNRDPRQIVKKDVLDSTNATISWSPDSKQVLVKTQWLQTYLLDADRTNDLPRLVADLAVLENDWKKQEEEKKHGMLTALKGDLQAVATTSMNIIAFSPDETKILYEATAAAMIMPIINPALIGTNTTEEVRDIKPGTLYVYDVKEDRNYFIIDSKTLRQEDNKTKTVLPSNSGASLAVLSSPIQWLPSSRHLLLTGKDKVEVMDYDATNRKTVYAGPFWDGFVAPWSNAGRIVVLTNLNPGVSSVNNLYAVNIR